MQIFSAVGKKTFGKKGRFVVEAAGEEYYLVNMEVYIGLLYFGILLKKKISTVMY